MLNSRRSTPCRGSATRAQASVEGGGIGRYISCSWLLLSHVLPGGQIHPRAWDVVQTAQPPGHTGSRDRVAPQGQWKPPESSAQAWCTQKLLGSPETPEHLKKKETILFSVSPQKMCPFTHGHALESRKSADTGMAFPAGYEESGNECDHWAGLGTHQKPVAWRYFKNAKFCCDPF